MRDLQHRDEDDDDKESIHGTAPTNLPSGYELVVDIDGSYWTVQVPDGGVSTNEVFCAKVLGVLHKTQIEEAELVSSSSTTPSPLFVVSDHPETKTKTDVLLSFDVPVGRWRDGIFDCCIIPFHPIFFLTCCCHWVALGQVMTRIRYGICCTRSTAANARRARCKPFHILLMITILYFPHTLLGGIFTSQLLSALAMFNQPSFTPSSSSSSSLSGGNGQQFSDDVFAQIFSNATAASISNDDFINFTSTSPFYDDDELVSTSAASQFQQNIAIGLLIFILIIHAKTRNQIRRAYSIGTDVSWLGDCCCACWCTTCSICQMARHTANYRDTHRARCCTPTGLDEEWDDYDFLAIEQQPSSPLTRRSTGPIMV